MPETKKDASALKGKTGVTRLVNATRYSCQGFAAAWKTEEAFRQEAVLAVVLIPLAVCLPLELTEKLLMIAAVVNVVIVEVLNSAVEAVVDRFGGEIHPLSGKAKDLGSAAVLLALCLCAGIWISILWARFC
jgi:diacylglycerol kinase (ATP)